MKSRYLQIAIYSPLPYVCVVYLLFFMYIRFQEKIRMIYDLQLFSRKVIYQRYN